MQHKQFDGAAQLKAFFTTEQIEDWKARATHQPTKEEKLKQYNLLATEYEVTSPRNKNHKERRSKLGGYVNGLLNTTFKLPHGTGLRRHQIQKSIKYGRLFLMDNPHVSVYFAATEGVVQEYREWMTEVGDLTPEQQMAILSQERQQ